MIAQTVTQDIADLTIPVDALRTEAVRGTPSLGTYTGTAQRTVLFTKTADSPA
jgi:hypothetical protein